LEGQDRNRVARLYLEALSSLFVASYDSQVYGGDIRPRLHTESYMDFHRAKKIDVFIISAARTSNQTRYILFQRSSHISSIRMFTVCINNLKVYGIFYTPPDSASGNPAFSAVY
jgi:hypothetical protein